MTTASGLATAIAAHGLEPARDPLIAEPLDDDAWRQLFEVVSHQRLIGLLAAAVGSGEFPLSRAQQGEMDYALYQSTMTTLFLERSLIRLIELLTSAEIDYRVMKGAAVAHLDYSNPTLRPYIDVDLLVPASSFDEAVALFSSHGCVRRHAQPRAGFDRRFTKGATFLTSSGHELDLHRTFVGGAYSVLIRADDLFEAATPFRIGGHELWALGAEERFLNACFHARLGDRPARLLPLRDIVQLVLRHSLDLERIAAMCDSWRAESVVAEAVHLAWESLGVSDIVPLSAWAATHRATNGERRRLAGYRGGSNYPALCVSALRAMPTSERFAFLYAMTLPDREYLDGRHRGHLDRWRYGARRLRGDASHSDAPVEGGFVEVIRNGTTTDLEAVPPVSPSGVGRGRPSREASTDDEVIVEGPTPAQRSSS